MPAKKTRGVLLPAEHGSWGMIAEPLLLGLLIGPTLGGFCLAVVSFCGFLLRTPALRLLRARRVRHPDPEGQRVRRFVFITGLTGAIFLFIALLWVPPTAFLPFLYAAPLVMWTLWKQDQGHTRTLAPELAAAIALASPTAAIVIAGGHARGLAWLLAGLLALKSVSAILFVRCQIRRYTGGVHRRDEMIFLHAAIPSALLVLEAPPGAVVLFLLLALRAGVWSFLPVKSPKHVGWTEIAVSLLFVSWLARAV
ncbi:MAG: YwiC-like family protein [Verrucomicrobia bacterium]|nr:YwiC-like family protein [Verrucomicrobiota bacterium]MCH8528121.1 YwiC-like family protein [Kiritimatiellia bacterium]